MSCTHVDAKMNISFRKLGVIRTTDEILRNHNAFVLLALTKFIPVHVEFKGDWYYTGICNDFDEVKEGESIPNYEVQITDMNTVEFIRAK